MTTQQLLKNAVDMEQLKSGGFKDKPVSECWLYLSVHTMSTRGIERDRVYEELCLVV